MFKKLLRLLGFKEHYGIPLKSIIINAELNECAIVYVCQRCGSLAIARINQKVMTKARFLKTFCRGKVAIGDIEYLKWLSDKLEKERVIPFDFKLKVSELPDKFYDVTFGVPYTKKHIKAISDIAKSVKKNPTINDLRKERGFSTL
jgi:hypothetical protein